jgi:hypothetical protein
MDFLQGRNQLEEKELLLRQGTGQRVLSRSPFSPQFLEEPREMSIGDDF